MKICKVWLVALLAGAVAGCASNSVPDPDPESAASAEDAGADTGAYEGSSFGGGQSLASGGSGELDTVIYFDYDQSELRPEYLALLSRHADRLAHGSDVLVRLEGHADERGSREYNVGLGERRSQAVRRILVANGVPADHLSTISYGEERPAMQGHDERSWSMNRRVVIQYLN